MLDRDLNWSRSFVCRRGRAVLKLNIHYECGVQGFVEYYLWGQIPVAFKHMYFGTAGNNMFSSLSRLSIVDMFSSLSRWRIDDEA